MADVVSALLLIVGAGFLFLAALGLVRMPDLFMRMSAATKGATFGVGAALLAAALYFADLAISIQAIATVAFVLLTAPVAAHMIGRAAYFDGVPLWGKTQVDELCDQYNARTHALEGRPCLSQGASEEGEAGQAQPASG